MSRSGMQYSQSGILAPKRSNVNRFLPQGGFQSVNESLRAEAQCKLPEKREPNADSMDDAGSLFGYGTQDVFIEPTGSTDAGSNETEVFTSATSDENGGGKGTSKEMDVDEDDVDADYKFSMPA